MTESPAYRSGGPGPSPLEALSIARLRERTSMKWRTHPPDVLPLWVAEMDVPLAPAIADSLHAAIDRGDTGYPAGAAYAEAVGSFAADRWGWSDFPVAATAIVPDVMLGIVELLKLVTRPGDPVVVNAPVYPPFHAFTIHADRRIIEAPLAPSGRLDPDALAEAFARARAASPRAAYLLSNPHNPTGVVHTRGELERVAALAREHGVRVIADEIHAPLILPGAAFVPYLTVAGAEDAFSVLSASKAWNLAGLKAALAIPGPAAAADLARMPEEVSHGPSHLGIIAHTAAFADGGRWLDELIAGLAANRELLGDLVATHLPGVGYRPPEGTYLAWLDCRRLGLGGDDAGAGGPRIVSEVTGPARFFLEYARVALSAGEVFGSGGAGHVRLNFACSSATLTEALERMGAALRHRVTTGGDR